MWLQIICLHISRDQRLIINQSLIGFEAIDRKVINILIRIAINDRLTTNGLGRNLFVNDSDTDYRNSCNFCGYVFFIFFCIYFQEITYERQILTYNGHEEIHECNFKFFNQYLRAIQNRALDPGLY